MVILWVQIVHIVRIGNMTDTYNCFGCNVEFDRPAASMLFNVTEQTDNPELCSRCTTKILMRKGSL